MKKIYALFCVAMIVLAISCKKDEPSHEPEKEVDALLLVGKWKMTKQLYTAYIDGELEAEDVDVLSEDPSSVEFKADGTGMFYWDTIADDYTLFTYEANGTTSFVYTKQREFVDGKLIYTNEERQEQPIPKLTSTTLEIHSDHTEDVMLGGIMKKRRLIFKDTYTRIK